MKTTGIALVLGFSLGAFLACPAMATDKAKFDKLIGKYVGSSAPFRPKTACVCPSTFRPGFLRFLATPDGDIVGCSVPTFDGDGKLVNTLTCTSYMVLGK